MEPDHSGIAPEIPSDAESVAQAYLAGDLNLSCIYDTLDKATQIAVCEIVVRARRLTPEQYADHAAADAREHQRIASMTPGEQRAHGRTAARTGMLPLSGVEYIRDEDGWRPESDATLEVGHRRAQRAYQQEHVRLSRREISVVALPRVLPRQRGAGRPKAAAQRSCARSGDSGDSDPHPPSPRVCSCGCGASLAGRRPQTRYHADACRERDRRRGDRSVDLDLRGDAGSLPGSPLHHFKPPRLLRLAVHCEPVAYLTQEQADELRARCDARECRDHRIIYARSSRCPDCFTGFGGPSRAEFTLPSARPSEPALRTPRRRRRSAPVRVHWWLRGMFGPAGAPAELAYLHGVVA
ncbi:MAG: hypothetical protein WAU69_03015 [Solirubrobacteraceae bacterium]